MSFGRLLSITSFFTHALTRFGAVVCALLIGTSVHVSAQSDSLSLVKGGGSAMASSDLFESRYTICGKVGETWKPGELVNGAFYPIESLIAASMIALKSAEARGAPKQVEQLKLNIRDLNMRLPLEQQECEPGPQIEKSSVMRITSSAVVDYGMLPSMYTCYGADGVRRERTGMSPPFRFENIPPKTTSLLLMLTEEGKDDVVGWQTLTVTNKSPSWSELQPQLANATGIIINQNSYGDRSYAGPCPLEGHVGAYRYELYALSGAAPLSFGSKAQEIREKIKPYLVTGAVLNVQAFGGDATQLYGASGLVGANLSCGVKNQPSGRGNQEYLYDFLAGEGWLSLEMNAMSVPDRIEIFDGNNPGSVIFSSRSIISPIRLDTITIYNPVTKKNERVPCVYREGDFSGVIKVSFMKPEGVTQLRVVIDSSYPSSTGWSYTLSCVTSSPPPGFTPQPTPTLPPGVTRAPTNTPTNTLTPRPTNTPTKTYTPRPSITATSTFTPAPTFTATPTRRPTIPATPTFIATPTRTPIRTSTAAATHTAVPTKTSTPTFTATHTKAPTVTPSATFTATHTAAPTRTSTPTFTATHTKAPTVTPSATFTATHTAAPTKTSTPTFTATHTKAPTVTPSATFTATHTAAPTKTPTPTFTATQTKAPTVTPSATFTATHTRTPTVTPSATFTATHTAAPTKTPTPTFTSTPTLAPTQTPTFTATQTRTPTATPSATFTATPTAAPTKTPTPTFTATPTRAPTLTPTFTATQTKAPTVTPSATFTPTQTAAPTKTPTPTLTPTATITQRPTLTPTQTPAPLPTQNERRVAKNFDATPKKDLKAGDKLLLEFTGLKIDAVKVRIEMQDISGRTTFACPAPLAFKIPPSGAITLVATLPKEISFFRHIKLSATMPNWGASQLSTVARTSAEQATQREMRAVCAAIQKATVSKSSKLQSSKSK